MNISERTLLLAQWLLKSDNENEDFAANVCWTCSQFDGNNGEGHAPCRYSDLCATEDNDMLKRELLNNIEILIESK